MLWQLVKLFLRFWMLSHDWHDLQVIGGQFVSVAV